LRLRPRRREKAGLGASLDWFTVRVIRALSPCYSCFLADPLTRFQPFSLIPPNTDRKGRTDHPLIPDGDMTYRIIGRAMRVHGRLGPGLFESAYHRCHELVRAEILFDQ
jgi:hypothetical protein